MDNSFIDNIFQDEKLDNLNINVNSNIINVKKIEDEDKLLYMPPLNINEERQKNEIAHKEYGQKVMYGQIHDPYFFEAKKEDIKLKDTIELYLPELMTDNYIIEGKKSNVDMITENVQAPYRFGIKSIFAKGKQAWHSYKLKKEYLKPYKDRKNLIMAKLENKNYENSENEIELSEELQLTEHHISNCPEFDETTYKFRKNAKEYNEEKKREEENNKEEKVNLNRVLNIAMSFHFKAALCNESYMTTHYHDLRKNIDQCILLPELLKRDEKYWNTLSDDMKDMIELQAETAQLFKDLFIQFGKKHYIDVMTGNFFDGKFDEGVYKLARTKYQKALRENYRFVTNLREKNSFPLSKNMEKLYHKLGWETMDEDD